MYTLKTRTSRPHPPSPCFPRSFLWAAPGGSPEPFAAARRHGLPAPRRRGGAGAAGAALAVRVAAAGAELGPLRRPVAQGDGRDENLECGYDMVYQYIIK